MDFRCIETACNNEDKKTNNVLANVLAKSAVNLQASKCFLGCDEFNTMVENKVNQSKADWHCTLRTSQLIS